MTSAVRPDAARVVAAPAPSPRRRRSGLWLLKPAIFALSFLPAALLAWNALHDALGANPIERLELETGRWTLRFLAATLAISPLRRATGWNELIKLRRMLGLFTFSYATLHLSMFIGLDMFFDVGDIVEDVAEHLYITVGMATYLLLIPLAVTSTKGWIRRLGGRRWQRLHQLVYLAAIGGTVHYLWAVKKDTLNPLIYAAIFAVLLGVRLWWKSRGPGTGDRG